METRTNKLINDSLPIHSNSTGNLYELGHQNNVHPPRTGRVVEAFSHANRRHHPNWSRPLLTILGLGLFATLMTSSDFRGRPHLRGAKKHESVLAVEYHYYLGGAIHPGYFMPQTMGSEYSFAAISDLDKQTSKNGSFHATLFPGILKRIPSNGRRILIQSSIEDESSSSTQEKEVYEVYLDPAQQREITTRHNEYGRGAEFSDLTLFDNRLLSFDDRTGQVVELLNAKDGQSTTVVPRFVLTEGNGNTNKGMKLEWATVKDGELHIGSIGKELTDTQDFQMTTSEAGMWIAIVNPLGQIRRVDWTFEYDFVRLQLFAEAPGYVVHEAVQWSSHLQKWVFLPRRISHQPYDGQQEEQLGSNKVLFVDESFSTSETVTVKFQSEDTYLGFSSFAFVPHTQDQHILGIRSLEQDCYSGAPPDKECHQESYLSVFETLTGKVLMEEVLISKTIKLEGLEFVNLFTTPPQ